VAVVRRAYRFALDPSPAQERSLRSHAGAARFAWNWALAKCRERYTREAKWYSAAEMHKLWNTQKKADPALGWWTENSKCTYQEAFRNLDRALRDFTRSRMGECKGKRLSFPRSKKRGRLHARIASIRADALHKATTMLAVRYESVAVEDLNVAGMTRNRTLARAVTDQGLGGVRRMLAYKTAWHGGTLVLADRWYPSSKQGTAAA
jgi:IS605 OrfB family transposase